MTAEACQSVFYPSVDMTRRSLHLKCTDLLRIFGSKTIFPGIDPSSISGNEFWQSPFYLWRESTTALRNNERKPQAMGLDLLLFQADKDGIPEAIKESQRARFKSETIVDEIQADYKQWVKGTCF